MNGGTNSSTSVADSDEKNTKYSHTGTFQNRVVLTKQHTQNMASEPSRLFFSDFCAAERNADQGGGQVAEHQIHCTKGAVS